jgi:hypothetical protein
VDTAFDIDEAVDFAAGPCVGAARGTGSVAICLAAGSAEPGGAVSASGSRLQEQPPANIAIAITIATRIAPSLSFMARRQVYMPG